MSDNESKLKDETSLNFKVCFEEVRFFKQQQWRVTYYCLLLFAVLFYLNDDISDGFLLFCLYVVLAIGLILLIDIQRTLNKNRKIIANFLKSFEKETKARLNINDQEIKKYKSSSYGLLYIIVFSFVLILAHFVVLYAIITCR